MLEHEAAVVFNDYTDNENRPINMRAIFGYRGAHAGADDVLLVGAGPSAARAREYITGDTLVMVCNSAITGLRDRADYFMTTEAGAFMLPWFMDENQAVKVVSYKNLQRMRPSGTLVPVERGWHIAGFHPREYANPNLIDKQLFADRQTPYHRHSKIGLDQTTRREWGLLKGPVCYPGNQSSGTVCLQGLHLLAYMGCAHVNMIGFDLHYGDGAHWTEPAFKYVPTRWATPDCFVKVNGKPSMWHFVISAALINHLRPVFHDSGMTFTDYSGGLIGVPGIETLLPLHAQCPPKEIEL